MSSSDRGIARVSQGAGASPIPSVLARSPVVAVVVTSEEGSFVAANQTFLRVLRLSSVEPLVDRPILKEFVRREADRERWRSASDAGDDIEMTFVTAEEQEVVLRGHVERLPSPDGRSHWLRGVFADSTPALQLRDVLLRTAGMEAVSSMAAGVCHDFNNLLTVLVGNLYLVAESLRENPVLYEKLRRARDAAKRGADLSRQLMAFARDIDSETQTTVVDVGKAVRSLLPLLTSAVGSKVTLQTQIDSGSHRVRVSRAQLESVITNLVVNARDALASTPVAAVIIKAKRLSLDRPSASRHGLSPGNYIVLRVLDNGAGIPPEVLERVFEPFFSTKGKTKGNGLGLPMVRWFAERSGGAVSLTSNPSGGTCASVFLPECEADGPADSAVMTMPLSSLPGGQESIVVVALDADFRSTVEQILGTLGYDVSSSDAPQSGLLLATERRASCLVIDSHVLSETTVRKMAGYLRRGNLGVVVVGDLSFDFETGAARTIRVPKPFSLPELSRAVRDSMKGDE